MSEHTYTLSEIKDAVFKALDEYSIGGKPADRSSGSLADMNERFVEALNQSIRKVYLSLERRPSVTHLSFTAHELLLECKRERLPHGEVKTIPLPQSAGSFAICYTGDGRITFYDGEKTPLKEINLDSQGGVFCTDKDFVPEGAQYAELGSEYGLIIEYFKVFSEGFMPYGKDYSSLLPDGKYLFCSFPKNATEICSVFCGNTPFPCDLFTYGDGYIFCEEKYAGSYIVEYFCYPPKILETDLPDTPIPFSPTACTALIYATAASLCAKEDGELYTKLMMRYQDTCQNRFPASHTKTKNSFYAGGAFGRRKKQISFGG